MALCDFFFHALSFGQLCSEVFEHISHPWDAARGLYKLLRPGGLVFFSVPFTFAYATANRSDGPSEAVWHALMVLGTLCGVHRFHTVPNDYFRYTPEGAEALLTDAGFEVLVRERGGNTQITTASLLGFGSAPQAVPTPEALSDA